MTGEDAVDESRVDGALIGQVELRDLTTAERREVNRAIDNQITDLVEQTDYRARLLAEGITVVYIVPPSG